MPPSLSDTLTPQQAAAALNVSRAYVADLLDRGALPFEQHGRHRRILRSELLAFTAAQARQREQQLQLLASQAQALRLGYE